MPSAAVSAGMGKRVSAANYPAVSGLKVWAVSDDVVDDGSGKVSSLTDRVNGYIFNNTNAATRFTIDTTDLPGHKVCKGPASATVRLSNTDAALYNIPANSGPFTVFCRFKPMASSTINLLAWDEGASANTRWITNFKTTAGASQTRLVANVGATDTLTYGTTDTTHYWTYAVGYDASANAKFWLNGVLGASIAFVVRNGNTFAATRLGQPISNNAVTGAYFAAWGILDRLATDAEALTVHTWCTTNLV